MSEVWRWGEVVNGRGVRRWGGGGEWGVEMGGGGEWGVVMGGGGEGWY